MVGGECFPNTMFFSATPNMYFEPLRFLLDRVERQVIILVEDGNEYSMSLQAPIMEILVALGKEVSGVSMMFCFLYFLCFI